MNSAATTTRACWTGGGRSVRCRCGGRGSPSPRGPPLPHGARGGGGPGRVPRPLEDGSELPRRQPAVEEHDLGRVVVERLAYLARIRAAQVQHLLERRRP